MRPAPATVARSAPTRGTPSMALPRPSLWRRLPRDTFQLRAERAVRDDAAVRRPVRRGYHVLRHGALADAVSVTDGANCRAHPLMQPTGLLLATVPVVVLMPTCPIASLPGHSPAPSVAPAPGRRGYSRPRVVPLVRPGYLLRIGRVAGSAMPRRQPPPARRCRRLRSTRRLFAC